MATMSALRRATNLGLLPTQAARCFSTTPAPRRIQKIRASAAEAISEMKSGSTVLVGGFGFSGVPSTLISAVAARPRDLRDLVVVSNNAGMPGVGLGKLLETRQMSKMIASFIGENKTFERMYLSGELDVELTPQGTIAEKCAAGAAGVPAFYTPAAYGTIVQTGGLPVRFNSDGTPAVMSRPRETREFHGKNYVMEESIFGDVALVKVHKADRLGNCTFRKAQNNFNEVMAKNARLTIVEADEIVEVGKLAPENIHIQGIYVDAVIQSTEPKRIEKLTLAKSAEDVVKETAGASAMRERIVRRAARELKDGMYVNLGIGIPLATPALVPEGIEVILQSENGILGMGRYPHRGDEDPDLINPGKETVTLNEGASVFGSHESFGMIRAGRINLTMLGALQVSMNGDLANFMLPGKVKGIGGAMDLVASPEKTAVVVTMEHVDKKGNPKILRECTFPLTGQKCVSKIITDIAVFDCSPEHGLVLRELHEDTTMEQLEKMTDAPFTVSEDFRPYQV
ncbi:3-oxoacid CoA-transferase [Microdochium nivale]|nr:3-oxoacid CoA-transferase [Microdochium nivale]